MERETNHICVCVCTYKRPVLLQRLLAGLERQRTQGLFTYSAVVVDNDLDCSAQATVEAFRGSSKMAVEYAMQPERNISLTRNMAVAMSRGQYLAFIDDDEFPGEDWLYNLLEACLRTGGDSILGPVEPFYEKEPPDWLVKGRLCERDHFKTGTPIRNPRDTRTGNVLVRREICMERKGPFDPGRGKSGGEDYEFFNWMLEKGYSIFWCDEAPVHESVPAERMKRAYFLKRGLLRGSLSAKRGNLVSLDTMKSLIAVGLYGAGLPFFAFLGHHVLIRYLMKSCDHAGNLLGRFGIELMKERTF